MIEDQWWGCYDAGLKGMIGDASFAHPAKVSLGLARRIYRHALDEHWLTSGSLCLDPMAGVATFGLVAATFGIYWLGIELEERFVGWGQGNIALHTREWLALGKPLPRLVPGDARELRELLVPLQADCVLSSPPYADGCRGYGTDPHPERAKGMEHSEAAAKSANTFRNGYAEPQAIISSPPYSDSAANDAQRTFARTGVLKGINEGDTYKPSTVITSPPYADSAVAHVDGNVSGKPGGTLRNSDNPVSAARHAVGYSQPSAVISSPPFLDARQDTTRPRAPKSMNGVLAEKAGHIHRLGACEYAPPACVVSSPPFSQTTASDWHVHSSPERLDKLYDNYKQNDGGMTREQFQAHCERRQPGYGQSSAQLGAMREGSLAAVITSPPWEKGAEGALRRDKFRDPEGFAETMSARDGHGTRNGTTPRSRLAQMDRDIEKTYGESAGQVGNLSHETYWSEMSKIYAACHDVLPVGGHIILVVKGFVRRGAYQDLPKQTAQLLAHVGFTLLHYHHAMLTSPVGQARLFDDGEDRTSRKSFFRRLAEKKGAPVIDHEAVLCAVKS